MSMESTASSSSVIVITSREFPLRFVKENEVNDVLCADEAVSRNTGIRAVFVRSGMDGRCLCGILGGVSEGVVGRGEA